MVPITSDNPELATPDEAGELLDLLCMHAKEIELEDYVCKPEKRQECLEKWLMPACQNGLIWTIRIAGQLYGMLMMNDEHEIGYVAVRATAQRRGVGKRLVQHMQSRPGITTLYAQAQNQISKHMLERCGFIQCGMRTSKRQKTYPLLKWSRL